MNNKNTLSTGEMAEYCGVGYRTVIRWVKTGQLAAFQLPGRGDRRIPIEECLRFFHENRIPIPRELSKSPARPKVLIVEDDTETAEDIRLLLTKNGYDTETVSDGFIAGARAMKIRPQLLILDLGLPRLDGFQVINFLRHTPDLKHIRILVMSGMDEIKLNEAEDLGADAVLAKPVPPKLFLAKVRELLSTNQ